MNHRVIVASFCFFLPFFVAITSVHAAPVILDGDFEDLPQQLAEPGTPLTLGAWTFENFAGVETGGNPGLAVRLEHDGSHLNDPTAAQTVAGFTIGETYTLWWDMALRVNHSGSDNGPSFGVFLDTQTFANALHLETYLSTVYKTVSVDFTATDTTHKFIFAGELDNRSNGAGTTDVSYRLDNVRLSDATAVIPSPVAAVIAMPLLGFFAVMRPRRPRDE